MMRVAAAALLVVAHASTSYAMCGPGTVMDKAKGWCVIATEAPRDRRDKHVQPTLSSKDGNVIIEVADGKQIGYKIGTGKMVSLGDVIPNLQDFTATSGSAMVRSFADIMDFGFQRGKAEGGDNAILSYIKGDLTKKVDGKAPLSAIPALETKLTKSLTAAAQAQLALKGTVANNLKGDQILAATVASLTAEIKTLKENALKGADLGLKSTSPAVNCYHIYKVAGPLRTLKNGMHFIKPDGKTALTVYCKFDGRWPGSTLMSRNPGRNNNKERQTGAWNYPCDLSKMLPQKGHGNVKGYCKLSDAHINMVAKSTEQWGAHVDAYIVKTYKGGSQTPSCGGFVNRACTWHQGKQAGYPYATQGSYGRSLCSNAHVRGGPRCERNQRTDSYRGIDGHHCPNGLNYRSAGSIGGSQQNNGRSFIIFEHSGGTTYCGGWYTSWTGVELWLH